LLATDALSSAALSNVGAEVRGWLAGVLALSFSADMVDVINIYLRCFISASMKPTRDCFLLSHFRFSTELFFDFEEGSYVSVLGPDYIYWLFYAR
jgi:hypothetical protein